MGATWLSGQHTLRLQQEEDLTAFRKGTPWGRSYLGDDLSESMRLANRKLWILIERVADDYLRAVLKATPGDHGLVCSAESHLDAEAAFMKAANTTNKTLEQVGTALRGLY